MTYVCLIPSWAEKDSESPGHPRLRRVVDFTPDATMEYRDPDEADYIVTEASADKEYSWTCCPIPPDARRSSMDRKSPSGRKEEEEEVREGKNYPKESECGGGWG